MKPVEYRNDQKLVPYCLAGLKMYFVEKEKKVWKNLKKQNVLLKDHVRSKEIIPRVVDPVGVCIPSSLIYLLCVKSKYMAGVATVLCLS